MIKKEFRREIKQRNSNYIATTVNYFTDNGQQLASMKDNGKGEPYSRVLYFNATLLQVPCYNPKSKNMSFIERAKPEYQADFQAIVDENPDILQSEYINA